MNRIDLLFTQQKKVFIPYVTAGFPSVSATIEILHLLVDAGADIIELGFPFSDPTADGPTIQASSQIALQRGFHREDYFRILREFRSGNQTTPIVVFSYFNPVFTFGVENFCRRLKDYGVDGVLLVDVPYEEQSEIYPTLQKLGLHLIQLIAPTTPDERIPVLLQHAGGFIYQIALKGVTGARDRLPEDWNTHILRVKRFTSLPVCLGFGVSNGSMAKEIAQVADGVIVGSAIVQCIAQHEHNFTHYLYKFGQELASAIHHC